MKPDSATRTGAIILATAYGITILVIPALVHPLDRPWLIGIALLPAVVCFLFGIPKVVKPRAIMAVFHLLVYPLFAAITFGLPGAYIAYEFGKLFGRLFVQ